MKNFKVIVAIMVIVSIAVIPSFAGDFDIGVSLQNRYVWRGMDFGNTPVVQPYLSYSMGNFEAGAWSSWPLTNQGFNENDLYLSYTYKNLNITVFDYFYPAYSGDDRIDEFDEDGAHIIETIASYSYKDFSLMGAVNTLGNDSNHSKYLKLSYGFYNNNKINATAFIGGGDYIYSQNDDFVINNVGISVTKDKYTASYVINPDQKTSLFSFGISL